MLAIWLQAGELLAVPLSIDTLALHTAMGFGPELVVFLNLIIVRDAIEIDGCWLRLRAFVGARNGIAAVALDALAQPIGDTALSALICRRLCSAFVARATGAGLLVTRGQFEQHLTRSALRSGRARLATTLLLWMLLLLLPAALLDEIGADKRLSLGPVCAEGKPMQLEVIVGALLVLLGLCGPPNAVLRTLGWGFPSCRTCDPLAFVII